MVRVCKPLGVKRKWTKDFLLVIRLTALGCESASLTNYLKPPLRLG